MSRPACMTCNKLYELCGPRALIVKRLASPGRNNSMHLVDGQWYACTGCGHRMWLGGDTHAAESDDADWDERLAAHALTTDAREIICE